VIEDATVKALTEKLARLDQDRAMLIRAIQLMEFNGDSQPVLRFADDEKSSVGQRIRAVRAIIRQIEGRFSPSNIREHLKANSPDLFKTFKENTISGLFHTLLSNGEIKREQGPDGRAYYLRTAKLK
jgi:hypothetical protein